MAKEKDSATQVIKERKIYRGGGPSGALYGIGVIGALIYFWQHSPTFLLGVLGIFKALFWPAYLVYKALEIFNIS
jgi:hypothetical protein